MDRPGPSAILAWTKLLRAQHAALSAVEGALKRAGLPPLAWYDVLLELDRADEGLRPFELERRMLLPQYSLSRLLDRIVAAGYARRAPAEDDGRGQVLSITDEGRSMRRTIWPVYAGALVEAVASRINDDEATILAKLLDKLIGPA